MKNIRQLVLLGTGFAVMSLVTPAVASQYRNDHDSWNTQNNWNTHYTQFSKFIKKDRENEWKNENEDECEIDSNTFRSSRFTLVVSDDDCDKEHEHVDNEDCEDNGDNTSPVPVPAALPLMASGIGALGVTSWRRRRKAK